MSATTVSSASIHGTSDRLGACCGRRPGGIILHGFELAIPRPTAQPKNRESRFRQWRCDCGARSSGVRAHLVGPRQHGREPNVDQAHRREVRPHVILQAAEVLSGAPVRQRGSPRAQERIADEQRRPDSGGSIP